MQNFIENMRWVLDHPVYSRIISIVIIILVALVITRGSYVFLFYAGKGVL